MMKKPHSEGLAPNEALELLDNVSETFCLAKWKQVTLNLHTGTNSSCCLTPPSHIDLKKIQKNVLVFHNTEENLKDRKELLEGKKAKSCTFCWDQEEKSGKLSSERIYKSASPWASEFLEEVLEVKGQEHINPSYLEVSFSSKCNLKCMYCNPQTSSSFYEEVKKYGPYSDSQNTGDLAEIEKRFNFTKSESDNPYVKEFLNWFPDLVEDLKVIRFTGGEPLYSDGMFECLEILEKKSHNDLTIELNSNLSTSTAQISKLEKSLNKVTVFSKKRIITSLDTWGLQSEYIRFGLSLEKFKLNFEYLLKNMPELEFRITVTFNILSAFNFNSLLSYILELKRKYKTYDKILLSIYPLISPYHLSIKVLDDEASVYLEESLAFMYKYQISNEEPFGFNDYEIDSFKKIIDFYTDTYPTKLKKTLQGDFYHFISDYDFRKKTSIEESFPEIKAFWNKCKSQNEAEVLSTVEVADKSFNHLKKLFKFAQKETSQTKEINLVLFDKITSCIQDLQESDIWEFINLLKYSKNTNVTIKIAKILVINVDFKFWKKLIELCPEILKYVKENKSFELRANEYILNDSELWSLGSFLKYVSKDDARKLLVNTEKDLTKRSIARLDDGREDWGLFPILDLFSSDSKKEFYNTLKPSMMNIKFNNSKVLAGTLYELIRTLSEVVDENFVDFIFDKTVLNTINKNVDSFFYGRALLKVKHHSKYINEKIFNTLAIKPSLVSLINFVDKKATDRLKLEETIKSLLLKQVKANNGDNIKIVKKYLNSISKDNL